MKIVFDPSTGKTNKYIDIIVSGLEKHGYEIYPISEIFASFKKFRNVSVVHLNWYENLDKGMDFVKRIVKLIALIIFRKKIVWTLHNKLPHNKKIGWLQKTLIYLLAIVSKKIVIHSLISVDSIVGYSKNVKSKIMHIPHPNYIDMYGKYANRGFNKNGVLNLLFIGAIKPYKNIELLIDVIKSFPPQKICLTIAGKPNSDAYKKMIEACVGSHPDIKLDLRYIDDSQLIAYIEWCDLLVLPYDIDSSLNSGTVILGFSYHRSTICPQIGTIEDLSNKDHVLAYSYTNSDEHKYTLKGKIEEALELKDKKPNVFEEWGNEMYKEVSVKNNREKVGLLFEELYESL